MFNPVFIFLVLLGAALLWFLLTFIFVPLGNILFKMLKRAEIAMNTDVKEIIDEEKENKEE